MLSNFPQKIKYILVFCLTITYAKAQSNKKSLYHSNILFTVENKGVIDKDSLLKYKYQVLDDTAYYGTKYINLQLNINFAQPSTDSLLWDYCLFSKCGAVDNRFNEPDTTNLHNYNIDSLIKKLNYSAIIVENKKGQIRIFQSIIHNKLYDNIYLPCYGCRPSDYEMAFGIGKDCIHYYNKPIIHDYKILLEDLQIEPNDNTIRLHYIFIPNESQKNKYLGFKNSFWVTSNWFNLIE